MTAPAPSPRESELPQVGGRVETAKRSKRMLGFYISTGVVTFLFVAGYFAWTPLRVWYWEYKVRRTEPVRYHRRSIGIRIDYPRGEAALKLAELGSSSQAAFRRLFRDKDPNSRKGLLFALGLRGGTWAVPLIMGISEDQDEGVRQAAADALKRIRAAEEKDESE